MKSWKVGISWTWTNNSLKISFRSKFLFLYNFLFWFCFVWQTPKSRDSVTIQGGKDKFLSRTRSLSFPSVPPSNKKQIFILDFSPLVWCWPLLAMILVTQISTWLGHVSPLDTCIHVSTLCTWTQNRTNRNNKHPPRVCLSREHPACFNTSPQGKGSVDYGIMESLTKNSA